MPSLKAKIARERRELMDLMNSPPFAIPSRKINENLLLATWNIQQFSNSKSDRALQYIADICERFDIVCLQEVKTDLRGLARLQAMLPGNYQVLVSDPTGNHERMAFLYDKRSVVATGLVCEVGFTVPAKTHKGYQLHRMPYCASFRAGRFDFVIATAHIFFGKTRKERVQRAEEIRQLAAFVDRRSHTAQSKVFDRDFFLTGDFNIEKQGDAFFKALAENGFVMPSEDLKTNFARDKTYDKIVWVNRKSFKFTKRMNVVPFGQVLFRDQKPAGGKKQISDHLPLWAEFEINELTQQLDQIINQG